jgi:hypothetical protein
MTCCRTARSGVSGLRYDEPSPPCLKLRTFGDCVNTKNGPGFPGPLGESLYLLAPIHSPIAWSFSLIATAQRWQWFHIGVWFGPVIALASVL